MSVENPDEVGSDSLEMADNSLNEELLSLIAKQSRMAPYPVAFAMGMIAVMASMHLPGWLPASWMGLVIGVLFLRWYVLSRLPGLGNTPIQQRLRTAIVFTAINALVHGLSLGFFPFLTDFERSLQSMIFMGISAVSIITTAGYRPISMSYLLPTLLPLYLLWAWNPGGEISLGNLSIAIIGLLYMLVLYRVSTDTFTMFTSSFENRRQLAVVNDRLQGALEQAESASQAKTRFLASASHDLRQPIHTLSLFSAALEMQKLDERTREITSHMNVAMQALASQLDALLDVSKLDAGVVTVNRSAVDLVPVLKRLAEEFSLSAVEKGLEVKLNLPARARVETDEVLFERIIRNLISNAIKYTQRGSIELKIQPIQDIYLLSIKDTGRGIAAEEQFKIFEEFYQPHNPERDRSRGLGLGLAIVRRLVDLLMIDLALESTVDAGTTFTLTLQRLDYHSGITDSQYEATDTNSNKPVWAGLQVLVVDDEVAIGTGMKTLLEAMGCQVDVTDSTAAAIIAARQRQPDIMLVDFRLRDKDNGLNTINAIREIYPGTPAILISGDTAPDRLREARKAGVELLHKPVLAHALEQAIDRACTP